MQTDEFMLFSQASGKVGLSFPASLERFGMSFALSKALAICAVAAAAAACSGPGSAVPNSSPAGSAASGFGSTTVRNAAPGPILSTSDGGQIFGFDIDQQGNDGVLASFDGSSMSVQTFNKKTGKIIKTFAVRKGRGPNRGDDYVADGSPPATSGWSTIRSPASQASAQPRMSMRSSIR
jgi:hypothetical protein